MKRILERILYTCYTLIYNRAVRQAERQHAKEQSRVFVLMRGWRMLTVTRAQYRKMLRDGNAIGYYRYVKRDSIYYTADRGGTTDLTANRLALKRKMGWQLFRREFR